MFADWKLKIQAFLHDPFDKQLVLFERGGGGHEFRAGKLLEILGLESSLPARVREADWNASAANRVWLVKPGGHEPRINFIESPALRHPLSGTSYNLRKHGGPLEKFAPDDPRVNQFVESARSTVESLVKGLKEKFADDHRRLFLSLWRTIPEALQKEGAHEYGLGQLWSLLPADSRMPDHSIWDHLSTASALVTALPEPAFFVFSIGPVQSFIETARKTRDLWMGSFLLSYLTWSAIKEIAATYGPDTVLFPTLRGQPLVDRWLSGERIDVGKAASKSVLSTPTFPNRFLALLPRNEISRAGGMCKEAVESAWREIVVAVKEGIQKCDGSLKHCSGWDMIWERQTSRVFDTFWAAAPWPKDVEEVFKQLDKWVGGTRDLQMISTMQELYDELEKTSRPGFFYGPLYELAERGLGSRKASFLFDATEEPGFKCSLCGTREALHDSDKASYPALKEFWERLSRAGGLEGQILPKGREKLCAVCLTKRLSSKFYFEGLGVESRFSSTSTVAVSSFLCHVAEKVASGNESLREAMDEFVDSLSRYAEAVKIDTHSSPCAKAMSSCGKAGIADLARLDGDWFFEETYAEDYQCRQIGIEESDELPKDKADLLRETKRSLRKFLGAALENGIRAPAKYFAVLFMDGDQMGRWLSGESAPKLLDTLHEKLASNPEKELHEKMRPHLEKQRPLAPSLHSAISRSLADFALNVARHVVEARHAGKLVYAGGDDVIALVTLEDLLDVLHELQLLFSGIDDGESFQNGNVRSGSGFVQIGSRLHMAMGEKATASIGVAVAHHKHPLSHVLQEARKMEKFAKNKLGRAAFAIGVLKHSGSATVVGAKWRLPETARNGSLWTIPCLKRVHSCFTNEATALSAKAGYQVAGESIIGALEPDAQRVELKRIIARHLSVEEPSQKEKTLDEVCENLFPLLEMYQTTGASNGNNRENSFKAVGEMLQFLSFLVRGELR